MKKLAAIGMFAAVLASAQVVAAEPNTKPVSEPTKAASLQAATSRININTASVDELQMLKGIGETKAKAIVDYRTANGKFKSVEELTMVTGIGAKVLEQNREQ